MCRSTERARSRWARHRRTSPRRAIAACSIRRATSSVSTTTPCSRKEGAGSACRRPPGTLRHPFSPGSWPGWVSCKRSPCEPARFGLLALRPGLSSLPRQASPGQRGLTCGADPQPAMCRRKHRTPLTNSSHRLRTDELRRASRSYRSMREPPQDGLVSRLVADSRSRRTKGAG